MSEDNSKLITMMNDEWFCPIIINFNYQSSNFIVNMILKINSNNIQLRINDNYIMTISSSHLCS